MNRIPYTLNDDQAFCEMDECDEWPEDDSFAATKGRDPNSTAPEDALLVNLPHDA